MSAMTLFYIAIVVYLLMITGLYLSVREFVKASAEPSRVKEPAKDNVVAKGSFQKRKYGS